MFLSMCSKDIFHFSLLLFKIKLTLYNDQGASCSVICDYTQYSVYVSVLHNRPRKRERESLRLPLG